MTDLATLLVEDTSKEIAKKAIAKGYSILDIADLTGLDETIIRQLQEEMNNK